MCHAVLKLCAAVHAVWLRHIAIAMGSACLLLPSGPVEAQTIVDWSGGAPIDAYDLSTNWTGGNVPDTASESARFDVLGVFDVTLQSGVVTTVGDLFVNDGVINFASDGATIAAYVTDDDAFIQGGDLTLSQSGGSGDVRLIVGDLLRVDNASTLQAELGSTVEADRMLLGASATGGTVTIDGASSLVIHSGGIGMGTSGGVGTLTFQNGSTFNSIAGVIDLVDGSGITNSTGRLNVLSGSSVETEDIRVGFSGSSSVSQEGTLTVSGDDSELTQLGASTLTIGDDLNPNVTSQLIISSGGQFSTGTGAILIQNSGHLDIQANGTFTNNGDMTLDGTTLDRAANGVFENGPNSTLLAQNDAQLNFNGDQVIDNGATWTLQSGADYNVDSLADDLDVVDGTLILEGSGTTLTMGTLGTTSIGLNGGTGEVTIRDGATAAFDSLSVGNGSSVGTGGILNIENTTQVTASDLDVAHFSSFSALGGTVNIDGTTGTARLTITGSIDVGDIFASNGPGEIHLIGFQAQLIGGTGLTTIDDSGLIEIDDGLFQANGDVLVNGGELRELNFGTFDLEPGLTLTANDDGQVNFDSSYDIDEDTTFLFQGGADFTATILRIGNGAGETGALTVEDPGSTVDVSNAARIGSGGANGSLTLRNGAVGDFSTVYLLDSTSPATATAAVESGAQVTSSSSLLINTVGGEGTNSTLTITGNSSSWSTSSLTLGSNSTGTAELHVLDGGSFTTTSTAFFNDTGVMTIDGGTADLAFHNTSGGRIEFVIGSLTTGSTMDVEPGGLLGHLVTLTPGKSLSARTISLETGGTVVLDGGSLTTTGTGAGLVDNGGTFQFQSGTLIMNGFNAFHLGSTQPLGGAMTLGAGQTVVLADLATVDVDGLLTLSGGQLLSSAGVANNGTLSIGAGSLFDVSRVDNAAGARLVIGGSSVVRIDGTSASTNSGEIILDGAGAQLLNDSTQPLTNSGLIRGDGTVTGLVNNSGELRTASGERLYLSDGFSSGNAGVIRLKGGELETGVAFVNNSAGNIVGRGTLRAAGTGLTNEGDLALSNGQTDVFGDVSNESTGRVIISGNADVTFWDDVTHTGALFNVSTGSSATFFGTAGFGVSGGGDVFFEADVTPGASPGLEAFGGNVHFGVLADLEIEIGGLGRGSQYDALDILGLTNLDGTLSVSLIDGFLPTAGDVFDIISAGELNGVFGTENLPALSGLLTWDVSYNSTNDLVTLAVVTPFSADFDGDGDVDNVDLGIWESAYGATALADADGDNDSDGLDFLAWQQQYTGTLETLMSSTKTVPEPCGVAIALVAIIQGTTRYRRLRFAS